MATVYNTLHLFTATPNNRRILPPPATPPSFRRSALVADRSTAALKADEKYRTAAAVAPVKAKKVLDKEEEGQWMSLEDYFEQAKVMVSSGGGVGPPRWFSPVECGPRIENPPLLLYLPGIDGLGLGLVLQQHKLGKIFDVWCLHIPVTDRTPFQELVLAVEKIVRVENERCPERPIYLVGESVGACLALAVAARNPDIDFVLILANPATCFAESQLRFLSPLLEVIPAELSPISIPYAFSLMPGDPYKLTSSVLDKGLQLEELTHGLLKLSSHFSVLADVLPKDTLRWKLQQMETAASYVNSRIQAVKAQVLLLASGRDVLLSSMEEADKIHAALPKQEIRVLKATVMLPKCEIRKFKDSGHFLFLEDGFDLAAVIKGSSFYRRTKFHDYVSDYLPPTNTEFNSTCEPFRWISEATGPVMLSTLDSGEIVRSLEGIPTEGPVVLVGYHMLLGLELYPLVTKFKTEKNILLRGLAHPMLFYKMQEETDLSTFDILRSMGAVPVTASNFYKLLSSGSHVLLYPGGMREACHKKGEAYQLFWPRRSEFVRMAAKFGAKIIPFGVVGEDDIGELVLDYEDQMKIPYLREYIEKSSDAMRLRTDSDGEVANQIGYLPGVIPKLPGRFYYLFGKPIDTAEMKQELESREKVHEVYLHVKSEVERCISYLKENREKDPYRSVAARTLYRATLGWTAEVPTFDI